LDSPASRDSRPKNLRSPRDHHRLQRPLDSQSPEERIADLRELSGIGRLNGTLMPLMDADAADERAPSACGALLAALEGSLTTRRDQLGKDCLLREEVDY
jgi:hypothetical protein